jgi:hypothetical protein
MDNQSFHGLVWIWELIGELFFVLPVLDDLLSVLVYDFESQVELLFEI